MLAAEIRVAIAEKDIEMHERNIEHARELDDFYRDKFTNRGFFEYMSRTLHILHRQAYEMAYETALMAQEALKHERGDNPMIILPGHWKADRAGLLAGEQLLLQIQQLERKYEELNTRELELTKHISLNQLNPLALLLLRETGKCDFAIPEELFDLDFPGHYNRRIKSVSISIPCVAGPYTSINATLRLNQSDVPTVAIATSSAQNDAGLFELNFRDERYLPFEGAGAISAWTLEMMTDKELRQFDYHTIADVIVHLRYTAREDGTLKTAAIDRLKGLTNALGEVPLQRLFSLRYDFPNEWHAWQYGQQPLSIKLEKRHFPYLAQVGDISIVQIKAFGQNKDGIDLTEDLNQTIDRRLEASGFEWQEGANLSKEMDDWYLLVQYSI